MILTKDNLLRYVRENKAVIPSMVAESFDTTTMIASAALSEIAKEKSILISHLKLSSSPYYYDPRQKEVLVEIGEKHLSKGDKEIFHKLKEQQVLSDNSLSIQESLAIKNIKDFAIPLEISFEEKELKFWVWFLRDIKETRTQILEAINPNTQQETKQKPKTRAQSQPKTQTTQTTKIPVKPQIQQVARSAIPQTIKPQIRMQTPPQTIQQTQTQQIRTPIKKQSTLNKNSESQISVAQELKLEVEDNPYETFIENFLKQNYLKVENKNKDKKGILYSVSLNLGKMNIQIDCYYFYKKTNEAELINFYTSSLKPKIVFIVKCPKKLLKLAEKVENLTIINI